MTENGKRLLTLKGVSPVEDAPEPKVDSAQILQQYQKKKALANASIADWDVLEGEWNADHTLNRLVFYKNGQVLSSLDFVWDATGHFLGAKRT